MLKKSISFNGSIKNDIAEKKVWIKSPLSIKTMTHEEFFERRNGAGRSGTGNAGCNGSAGR